MNISFKSGFDQCGMPLVYTDDRRLCFLIDTGASHNVLLRDAYVRERDLFGKRGKSNYLIGMEGTPEDGFIGDGAITIGGQTLTTSFGVLDASRAMETVRIITGLTIDGALGADFLRSNALSVDFGSLSLHSGSDSRR